MLVVAIIGMLAAIAVPNFIKARIAAQKNACIKNLSTIDSAKQIWGLENNKKEDAVPDETDLVGPTLYLKVMPICPAGGNYDFKPIKDTTTCDVPEHVLE
jgi:type II secretory pathway pseudopilin PulG